MKRTDLAFLKELIEAPSPTGWEKPAADVLRARLEGAADEIRVDTLGSVHAYLRGSDPQAPSVALAAHIDEVGLIVSYLSPEGYLSFAALGGVDAAILPGLRVDVHTTDGPLLGVLGRKPIHLIEADDRKTVTALEKLFIDVGLPADEVKKRVRVGDPITIHAGLERLGDDLIVSRALDDKMGAWIAARVLEELKAAGGAKSDFWCVGSVQEEIGMRGGATSAYALDPDIFIAVEVCHATDYPDIDKRSHGEQIVGKGPVFGRGPNIDHALLARLEQAARDEGCDYQLGVEPRATGTDANPAQLARGGKMTALVSIADRYMHTPTEVVSLADMESCVKILTRFVLDLDNATDLSA
ncbi:MAG: M20/M25/M40 family metallo-hydrolase [Actinomycetia bacterium]|nr:M20/M25/M40 family metallo-hydrolase [Actinomycetes bacterium]